MAKAVTHTFSFSNSLIKDLKKKIKAVEQELATIASTVKDLSISFPLIGQKEKKGNNCCYNFNLWKDHRKKPLKLLQYMFICLFNLDNHYTKICLYR